MQVDVVFRGSWASSFIPALNSLSGGVRLWESDDGRGLDGEQQQVNNSGPGEERELNKEALNLTHLSEAGRGRSGRTCLFQVFFPTEMSWKARKGKKKVRTHKI